MLKIRGEAKQGTAPVELSGQSPSGVERSAWGAGGSLSRGVRAQWGKGDIPRKEWLNKKCVRSWQGEGVLSGGDSSWSPAESGACPLGRAASEGLRKVPLGRSAKAAAQ